MIKFLTGVQVVLFILLVGIVGNMECDGVVWEIGVARLALVLLFMVICQILKRMANFAKRNPPVRADGRAFNGSYK